MPGTPREAIASSLYAIGMAFFFKGQFTEAASKLLLLLQDHPGASEAYRVLAACYAHMGRFEEARVLVTRLRSISPELLPKTVHWRKAEHRDLFFPACGWRWARPNNPASSSASIATANSASQARSWSSANGPTNPKRRIGLVLRSVTSSAIAWFNSASEKNRDPLADPRSLPHAAIVGRRGLICDGRFESEGITGRANHEGHRHPGRPTIGRAESGMAVASGQTHTG
jgi:tetratricopeptide (TPR) repeat protein